MADEIKVGVAGLTHGHVWGLIDIWKEVPGAKLVAVADPTPLMENAKDRFERQYTDWKEMLDKEELHALVVTSDNVESAKIACAALEKGIHCLVEKAMAASAADADKMLASAKKGGATLMINWPLAWADWLHAAKKKVDSGELGHIFHMRFKIGHHGPKEIGCDEYFVGWLYDEAKNGGGAIADFCSYGAVLSRWLFGMPDAVYAVRGNFTKDYEVPDDHALIVLKYPKRTVVLEGTWAMYGSDASANPVIYGKNGTLAVTGNELQTHVMGKDPLKETAPSIPTHNPAVYLMQRVAAGEVPEGILNPEIAADACRILDAAKESARTGAEVKL